jgi:hypothetical protein
MLKPTMVYCDNQSCIRLSKNLVFHDCSKYIDTGYYSLRDRVQKGAMVLESIPLVLLVANILTKPLAKGKSEREIGNYNAFILKKTCRMPN